MTTTTYTMPSNELCDVLRAIPRAFVIHRESNPAGLASLAVEEAFDMRPSAAAQFICDLSAEQWDVIVTQSAKIVFKATGKCGCGTFKDTDGKTHDWTCVNDPR